MKRKKILQLMIAVIIFSVSITGTNIVFASVVNVTDFGAKDFGAPVQCQLNGTSVIAATGGIGNLCVGDNVRIANGAQTGSPGIDLMAQITAINGCNITLNKSCGSSITTDVYIDSTQAFIDAFDYAYSNSYDVVIPNGNYYVDSGVEIKTDVSCTGTIYTSNKGTTPLFIVPRNGEYLIIPGTAISVSLAKGTTYIPEIAEFVGSDVILDSQEKIIKRNNPPSNGYYYKEEINRINSNGQLIEGLAIGYNDKSKLRLIVFEPECPITIDGLDIMCIDNAITNGGKAIVKVERSDVTFNGLAIDNENLSKVYGQRTGINIGYTVNVTLNNSTIRGFMLDGLGYGVSAIKTLYTTLNDVVISNTRHAVTGNGDNCTTIDGGSYKGYGGTIDSHWGYNYVVENATVEAEEGGRVFAFAGDDLTIRNCNVITDYRILVYRRSDTPSIKGEVAIINTTVTYTGDEANNDFTFYRINQTEFNHEATLYNPNLIIENVELVLDDDIGVVNIYDIDHDVAEEYTMQRLPDFIAVDGLHITGVNDTELENTYFNMMPATSMYYAGSPEVYLEDIIVNTGSSYDGQILCSFDPDNTEVPDTLYNIHVRDCGTLHIIPAMPSILGESRIYTIELEY